MLTTRGAEEAYQIGTELRERYGRDLLPATWAEAEASGAVYLRSTPLARTVLSLTSAVAGLYPADFASDAAAGGSSLCLDPAAGLLNLRQSSSSLAPPVVRVHALPVIDEYMFPAPSLCPPLGRIFKAGTAHFESGAATAGGAAQVAYTGGDVRSTSVAQLGNTKFTLATLRDEAPRALNLPQGGKPLNWVRLRDVLVALAAEGAAPPPGVTPDLIAAIDAAATRRIASNFLGRPANNEQTSENADSATTSDLHYYSVGPDAEDAIRLSVGSLLQEVLLRVDQAAFAHALAAAAEGSAALPSWATPESVTALSTALAHQNFFPTSTAALFDGPPPIGANDESRPRLCVYSAHDSTLIPTLMALNVWDGQWPKYASRLFIELSAITPPSASNNSSSSSSSDDDEAATHVARAVELTEFLNSVFAAAKKEEEEEAALDAAQSAATLLIAARNNNNNSSLPSLDATSSTEDSDAAAAAVAALSWVSPSSGVPLSTAASVALEKALMSYVDIVGELAEKCPANEEKNEEAIRNCRVLLQKRDEILAEIAEIFAVVPAGEGAVVVTDGDVDELAAALKGEAGEALASSSTSAQVQPSSSALLANEIMMAVTVATDALDSAKIAITESASARADATSAATAAAIATGVAAGAKLDAALATATASAAGVTATAANDVAQVAKGLAKSADVRAAAAAATADAASETACLARDDAREARNESLSVLAAVQEGVTQGVALGVAQGVTQGIAQGVAQGVADAVSSSTTTSNDKSTPALMTAFTAAVAAAELAASSALSAAAAASAAADGVATALSRAAGVAAGALRDRSSLTEVVAEAQAGALRAVRAAADATAKAKAESIVARSEVESARAHAAGEAAATSRALELARRRALEVEGLLDEATEKSRSDWVTTVSKIRSDVAIAINEARTREAAARTALAVALDECALRSDQAKTAAAEAEMRATLAAGLGAARTHAAEIVSDARVAAATAIADARAAHAAIEARVFEDAAAGAIDAALNAAAAAEAAADDVATEAEARAAAAVSRMTAAEARANAAVIAAEKSMAKAATATRVAQTASDVAAFTTARARAEGEKESVKTPSIWSSLGAAAAAASALAALAVAPPAKPTGVVPTSSQAVPASIPTPPSQDKSIIDPYLSRLEANVATTAAAAGVAAHDAKLPALLAALGLRDSPSNRARVDRYVSWFGEDAAFAAGNARSAAAAAVAAEQSAARAAARRAALPQSIQSLTPPPDATPAEGSYIHGLLSAVARTVPVTRHAVNANNKSASKVVGVVEKVTIAGDYLNQFAVAAASQGLPIPSTVPEEEETVKKNNNNTLPVIPVITKPSLTPYESAYLASIPTSASSALHTSSTAPAAVSLSVSSIPPPSTSSSNDESGYLGLLTRAIDTFLEKKPVEKTKTKISLPVTSSSLTSPPKSPEDVYTATLSVLGSKTKNSIIAPSPLTPPPAAHYAVRLIYNGVPLKVPAAGGSEWVPLPVFRALLARSISHNPDADCGAPVRGSRRTRVAWPVTDSLPLLDERLSQALGLEQGRAHVASALSLSAGARTRGVHALVTGSESRPEGSDVL